MSSVKTLLSSYFGKNADVSDMKEGENYEISLLRNHGINNVNFDIIKDRIIATLIKSIPKNFFVFEANGGLGETAIKWTEMNNVSAVYTFEQDEKMFRMLQNNVQLMKRQGVVQKEITVNNFPLYIPPNIKDFNDWVLFIKPNWWNSDKLLPQHVTSSITMNVYTNGKIQSMILEDIVNIEGMETVNFVVMYLPPSYNINTSKFGNYETFIKNVSNSNNTAILFTLLILKRRSAISYSLTIDYETGLLNSLKNLIDVATREFNFLGNRREEVINSIFNDFESKQVWLKAFTSDSYDNTNNYQLLETLGDAILKGHFVEYLIDVLKDANSAQITEQLNHHMSGQLQAKLFDQLNLRKFIRSKTTITFKTVEDVFLH